METVIFDRPMNVHYGFIWLSPEGRLDDLADLDPFAGQANGLCGAALPGILSMRTGLHTGAVPVRVVIVDDPPALGDAEDIVEVSFRPTESVLMLVAFHDGEEISLPLRSYRARWSATAMQAGRDVDTVREGESAPDRYELCLWPDDDPRADAIIRQGSQTAAYWHSTVTPG